MIEPVERECVIHALEELLQDSRFSVSPKSASFLRYVVYQTLNGHADRIKAYTIAVDALGMPSTFDPQSNPSVRVLAFRVRRMLAEYYDKEKDHDVILQMNAGSYIPQFIKSPHFYNKPNLYVVQS